MLKLLPKNLKDNIKRSQNSIKYHNIIPNNTKRCQNSIKYHNIIPNNIKIIPKITTFNTKPMLKEFKRITKIYQKNPKHYQVITQSINRQIIKNKYLAIYNKSESLSVRGHFFTICFQIFTTT